MESGKQNENRPHVQSRWMGSLDSREHSQIHHARVYARDHLGAGAPGHGQFLLIAKLADTLDWFERQQEEQRKPKITKVTWDETNHVWRHSETGVQVDHSLLTPAPPSARDLTPAPDASKKPKGLA